MCTDKATCTHVVGEHPLVAETRNHLQALVMEQAVITYKLERKCLNLSLEEYEELTGRALELCMLVDDAHNMYTTALTIAAAEEKEYED